MGETLLALAPIGLAAVWRYGTDAALVLLSAISVAYVTDRACDHGRLSDYSGLVTGMIVALLLPVGAPWWLAAIAGAMAVLLGKHAFGGIGQNVFNPAALSRGVLMGAMPTYFFSPARTVDGISSATPLSKEFGSAPPNMEILLGGRNVGTLGEAAPWVVIAVGVLLILRRTIDWRVPITYLSVVVLCSLVFPAGERMEGHAPWLGDNALVHVAGGGSLLAAFLLLTDPVTAPFTPRGRVIFAALAASYTMIVRFYTPYPDGAALAVLLANAATPLIDTCTLPMGNAPTTTVARRQTDEENSLLTKVDHTGVVG